jgi:hypothetical protein
LGAAGSVAEERFGAIAVAEGRMDEGLLEPLSAAATAQGRTFGAQMLADGLATPGQVAELLRLQATRRFEAILTMNGGVEVHERRAAEPVLQQPLGAAVVALFRDRLPLDVISELFEAPPLASVPTTERAAFIERLKVSGAELRVWRKIVQGESREALLEECTRQLKSVRFLGALLALGLLDW